MPPALAPALTTSYPHLAEQAVRLWPVFSPAKMRHNDVVFVESGIVFADASVLSLFNWPLIAGNQNNALTEKNSIVLTESMSKKYFGPRNPVGEPMRFWGNDLTVTGVVKDIPHNSHLQFDFLISSSTLQQVMGDDIDQRWDMPVFYTYVLQKSGVTSGQMLAAVQDVFKNNYADPSVAISLQPVTSIHLHSNLQAEFKPGGNLSYLYVLGTAALFILLLAGINFTNLSTARATTRRKEVGMRKTLGAVKRQLVEQFFGESLITSVISWIIALSIAGLTIPAFNQFAGKAINVSEMLTPQFLGGTILIVMLISFFAGSYPALFLSRLKPVSSLKGTGNVGVSNTVVRKGLVIFQFMISTFFLTGMVIVLLQLKYLQSKDLGFDRDQIIVLDGDGFPQVKSELRSVAGVQQVSGVPQAIPGLLPSSTYRAEGSRADSASQMSYYGVTPGFIETMGVKLVAGKSFTEESKADEERAYILNESAIRQLGWNVNEAIGKSFSMLVPSIDGDSTLWREGFITGVVQDFNHDVLYKKVSPLVLYPSHDLNLMLVRIQHNAEVIAAVKEAWIKVNPEAPFNYYWLNDRIRQNYESEMKLGTLMSAATVLAVIIACLGLSGLVSFSASQRTKEIGIRKVLGATSTQILTLLSTDFIKLVGIAAVISLPLAYFALKAWIINFAYHIDLSWMIFIATGLCTLVVAMLTVFLQSLRAARAQPTESLKSE
jgi:putative ABC transport system permease protein